MQPGDFHSLLLPGSDGFGPGVAGSMAGDDLLELEEREDPQSMCRLRLLPAVEEASRVLALAARRAEASGAQRDTYFSILRLDDAAEPRAGKRSKKLKGRQNQYHVSSLSNVIGGIEAAGARDIYFGHAQFATDKSRCITNVAQVQVAWVDVDCYALGIRLDNALIERMLERAAFCGIPRPSHIVRSGRGVYLKWLLTAPVESDELPVWNALQCRLASLYGDLGADFKALDAARVLRVVGSINSKVAAAGQETPAGPWSDSARVEVIWDTGLRHSFQSLCASAALMDIEATKAIASARHKLTHRVGDAAVLDVIGRHGDITTLLHYGAQKEPRFSSVGASQAEAGSRRGINARKLAWTRFTDLRDLMLERAKKVGKSGIGEGSRDLALFWMVGLLAQSGVVNSRNLEREVESLLPAFDGVHALGPRGFDPLGSSSLGSLMERIQARESGEKVQYKGHRVDPLYTPSNDLLINLFAITDDEMRTMRTIVSTDEKQRRADRKEPGRAERRDERKAWQGQALAIRAETRKAEPEMEFNAVVQIVATKLDRPHRYIRDFFRRQDAKRELEKAREAGKAPPKRYRQASKEEISGEELNARLERNAKARWYRQVRGLRARGYDLTGLDPAAINALLLAEADKAMSSLKEAALEAREKARLKVVRQQATLRNRIEKLREHPSLFPDMDGNEGGQAGEAQEVPPAPAESDVTDVRQAAAVLNLILRKDPSLRENAAMTHPQAEAQPAGADAPETPAPAVSRAPGAAAPSAALLKTQALLAKAKRAQKKAEGGTPDPEPSAAAPPATEPVARVEQPPDKVQGAEAPTDSTVQEPDREDARAGPDSLDTGGAPAWTSSDEAPVFDEESYGYADEPVGQAPPAEASALTSSTSSPPDGAPAGGTGAPAPAVPRRGFAGLRAAKEAAAEARGNDPPTPASAPTTVRQGFGSAVARHTAAASPVDAPRGFARLSPEQAAWNEQGDKSRRAEDFHVRLPSPSATHDNGMPSGYPDEAAWPDSDLPAGSRYTRAEWAQARLDARAAGKRFVYEMQVCDPIVSVFVAVSSFTGAALPDDPSTGDAPEAAASASSAKARTGQAKVVDGKVQRTQVQEPVGAPWDDPFGRALDGVIKVSRKSPARFPGAAEGGIETDDNGLTASYRIIRPRAHYDDPDRAWLINAKLRFSAPTGADRRPDVPVFPRPTDVQASDTGEAGADVGAERVPDDSVEDVEERAPAPAG